jgi:hypothetical protein
MVEHIYDSICARPIAYCSSVRPRQRGAKRPLTIEQTIAASEATEDKKDSQRARKRRSRADALPGGWSGSESMLRRGI